MTQYVVHISEGAMAQESTKRAVVERYAYEVATTMFKNQRYYTPGDTIMLDKTTAANFLAAGNIKEI